MEHATKGCEKVYKCCNKSGEGCVYYYPCCDPDGIKGPHTRGCKLKCVNCPEDWGTGPGCVAAL